MSAADEVVYQASPATCVAVARKAIKEALDELRNWGDLERTEAHLVTALGWLPPHLESEWDDHMAEWLHRTNERIAAADERDHRDDEGRSGARDGGMA